MILKIIPTEDIKNMKIIETIFIIFSHVSTFLLFAAMRPINKPPTNEQINVGGIHVKVYRWNNISRMIMHIH